MRLLIVDDDAIVAQSLATILSANDDIEVVGVGASGQEAAALYSQCSPDIVLMDIQMPGVDGLMGGEKILAADPTARIVFLTTFADDEYIVRALKMGARGYLIKQDIAQIAPALRSVMAGMSVLEGKVVAHRAFATGHSEADAASSEWTVHATAGGQEGARHHTADPQPDLEQPARNHSPGGGPIPFEERPAFFADVTEREWDIIQAISHGLDNAQIADQVFISVGTVRNHISAILAKLGLKNRTQIAVAYFRL